MLVLLLPSLLLLLLLQLLLLLLLLLLNHLLLLPCCCCSECVELPVHGVGGGVWAHHTHDARRIGSAHPSTWPRLLFLLFCASGARLFFLCVCLLGEGPKATRGLPQADQRPAACVSLLKLSVHAIDHATAAARSSAVELHHHLGGNRAILTYQHSRAPSSLRQDKKTRKVFLCNCLNHNYACLTP